MNLRFPFLFFLFLTSFLSRLCAQNSQQLRIDPSSANGGNVSDFFEEINFIPLETNSKSAFSSIDQLEVTTNQYFVLDRETNAILIFNKKGRFENKVTGASIGYNNPIHYFYYDSVNQNIVLPSPTKKNELIYLDTKGQVVKRAAINFYTFDDLFFLKSGNTAHYDYNVDFRRNSSIAHEVFLEKMGKITARYLPYNTKTATLKSAEILENSHASFYQSTSDTAVLFVRPYDYTIYRVSEKKLDSALRLTLPFYNTLPVNFRNDSAFNKARLNFFRSNPQVIYNVSHVYWIGNKLFLRLQNFKQSYSLVYNFNDRSLVDVLKLTPDLKCSYLSFNDAILGGNEFYNKNFLYCDETYLYTSYSALRFLNQKTDNKGKLSTYPSYIEKCFKSLNAQSNPIIVQIKPKIN